MAMIRVAALTKRYGRKVAVDRVSFAVGPGEAVALWGPNGAGKSTIVRCILGTTRFEGTIEIGGLDVRRHGKAARALLGYVPQELAFYADLTVAETVELSARLRAVDLRRGVEVIGRLGLGDERATRVGALSGGMKQRLAIGLALLADPPVLLLDEPTSSLDVAARETILELFEQLRAEQRALVLTTHHLEEVGMLVQRVLALHEGAVAHDCSPAELAERLGLRAWLHVVVDGAEVAGAVTVLRSAGLAARRNGRGLVVEVPAGDKGRALRTLHGAGYDVIDVDVWR
jgi:ABC-type multidrug transport system ATPase subunit